MRAGAGKAKGATYERKICTQLSLWVSDGKKDDVFWRSAMSGGRATVRSKAGKKATGHVAGDICAVHQLGHEFCDYFFVEAKHYNDLGLQRLLATGKGNVADFWRICLAQAKEHGKEPFLVAKQNLIPPLLLLRGSAIERLQLVDLVKVVVVPLDAYLIYWGDFLGSTSYSEFRGLLRPTLHRQTTGQLSLRHFQLAKGHFSRPSDRRSDHTRRLDELKGPPSS